MCGLIFRNKDYQEPMELTKKQRSRILKNSVCFVSMAVSVSCLLVMVLSTRRLPEISLGRTHTIHRGVIRSEVLGIFTEMMIEMLPEDLAFTIFAPSEKAFQRDLKLQVNDTLVGDTGNNTYAIVSRILGFSAVPRTLTSSMVPLGKEISYDSISGFELYISKSSDGRLVVNRVGSERVDLKKGKIILHIMDGVIMDPDFEQSVQPDDDEGD